VILAGLGWAVYAWILVPGMQPDLLTVSTGAEKSHFFLPDSSEVWLNAGSELQYEAGFRGATRRSTLKGEAFFVVRRNEKQPFVVTAGATRTQVLGTSFNVRAYEGTEEIAVSVATGKVSFGTALQQVALVAGDEGLFSVAEQSVSKAKTTAENANAWQTGRLVFDNRELAYVAQDLGRYFGVTVSFSDPALAKCHYSGSFDQPELAYALEVIAATVNMQYSREGNQVTFSGRGCGESER
jgi:ferric-dicitrate binding protein FerR (iron transport regulator)